MQAPVQKAKTHCLLHQVDGGLLRCRGIQKMIHRLGHTPKNDSNAHTGTKEHRKPSTYTEIGLGILAPQPDLAQFTDTYINTKEQEQVDNQHKEPSGKIGNTILD